MDLQTNQNGAPTTEFGHPTHNGLPLQWKDPLDGVEFMHDGARFKVVPPLFNQPYESVRAQRIDPTYGVVMVTWFFRDEVDPE